MWLIHEVVLHAELTYENESLGNNSTSTTLRLLSTQKERNNSLKADSVVREALKSPTMVVNIINYNVQFGQSV